ncbi:hypothetical protein CEXT_617071 [Caerostris extrusa]|uniref:Uncharacterized protein n=1 Tax=Caerostris extrusa TaxID=172846 RepID=A0AAV4XT52_CAEEX|nr:hypothetical protein CEXT_617071 [Caerostris extrusa]
MRHHLFQVLFKKRRHPPYYEDLSFLAVPAIGIKPFERTEPSTEVRSCFPLRARKQQLKSFQRTDALEPIGL